MTNWSVEEVTTHAELLRLGQTWETLFSEAETASPFNSWPWISTWWRVFHHGKSLLILVVREGNQVVGIAPFYRLVFRLGPARVRIVLPLGYGNDLTERLEPLIATGKLEAIMRCLGAYLEQRQSRLWDVLILNGGQPEALPARLRRLLHRVYPIYYETRPLPVSWSAFATELGRSMRGNLNYYPRLLARNGHTLTIRVVETLPEADAALATFLRLHRARADAPLLLHHDDRFGHPLHRRFLRQVTPHLLDREMLRVLLVSIDGEDVAAQIVLDCQGTRSLYYSGFDPVWQQYSVGMLATAACLREGMERGLRHADFLSGTGHFKKRWGTQTSTVQRVTLVSDAALTQLAFKAYAALHHLAVERTGLEPRHGVGARLRLLRWLSKLLGQPTLG